MFVTSRGRTVIVDAHHHLWDPALADYPCLTDDLAAIRRRFGPEDIEPLLREYGVDGTVVVQARASVDETRWLLETPPATSFVLGVVGWIDLTSAEAAQVLAEFGEWPARRHPAPSARRVRSDLALASRRAARQRRSVQPGSRSICSCVPPSCLQRSRRCTATPTCASSSITWPSRRCAAAT
jgi:predicted TIM-barrel fold metal-dependent hydrolase